MGLNIIVHDLSKTDQYGLPQRPEWWDYIRYSWDNEFVRYTEWELQEREPKSYPPEFYRRIKDPQQAREWIEANVEPEGNKERLLNLVDKMEADSNLVVYVCN